MTTTTEPCQTDTYILHAARPLNTRWIKLHTEIQIPSCHIWPEKYQSDILTTNRRQPIEPDHIEINTYLQADHWRKPLHRNCLNCEHIEETIPLHNGDTTMKRNQHTPQPVIDKAFKDAYTRLYQEAEPGADYTELVERAEKYKHSPGYTPAYKLHYLSEQRTNEIISGVINDHSIHELDQKPFKTGIILGASPTTCKETVNNARKQNDLEPISEEDTDE